MTFHAIAALPRALAGQLRTNLLLSCAVLSLTIAAPTAVLAAAQPPHVIYTFTGQGQDGYDPPGSMIMDSAGNLFGVTLAGGGGGSSNGNGNVFELTFPVGASKTRKLKSLYAFQGGADGSLPNDGLIMDAAGDLLGVTTNGGAANDGTIFMLAPSASDPSGYTKKTLYSFSGADGAHPYYGLTMDKAGSFFGTTAYGGAANIGTIFKLAPPNASGAGWTLTKLHDFAGADNAGVPISTLTIDAAGKLYGTTYNSTGTVYEFTPGQKGTGTFSVIYTFTGLNDGQTPFEGVSFTASGSLVGTAYYGGVDTYGTVYELTKLGSNWHEKTLGYFNGRACGEPSGKLLVAPNGHYFGVATQPSCVYEVTPRASGQGSQIDPLYGLPVYSAANGALVADTRGNLFGTDEAGGNVAGEIYKLPAAEKH